MRLFSVLIIIFAVIILTVLSTFITILVIAKRKQKQMNEEDINSKQKNEDR